MPDRCFLLMLRWTGGRGKSYVRNLRYNDSCHIEFLHGLMHGGNVEIGNCLNWGAMGETSDTMNLDTLTRVNERQALRDVPTQTMLKNQNRGEL